MIEEEVLMADGAVVYVKTNVKEIIAKFVDSNLCYPSDSPVSLFMAGSPGAGKTEVSKRIIEQFSENRPIRIDADEIRSLLPGYIGGNAHIFQQACSTGVHKLHDYALKHKLNLIMDGTFSAPQSLLDVERSVAKKRVVQIYYLYQEPEVAWKYTRAREATEGRRISKEIFIKSFLASRINVVEAKKRWSDKIELNLVINNFDKGIKDVKTNIKDIDQFLPKLYTEDDLNSRLADGLTTSQILIKK